MPPAIFARRSFLQVIRAHAAMDEALMIDVHRLASIAADFAAVHNREHDAVHPARLSAKPYLPVAVPLRVATPEPAPVRGNLNPLRDALERASVSVCVRADARFL